MEKVLHHMIHLKCDNQRAFEMFTQNELLQSWFPVLADVEPWVGGKYELFWDPTDKENNSTIGCKVTAVEQNKLIAFEWKGPLQFKEFMNQVDPLTHVVVFFLNCSNKSEPCTEVHIIHSGWKSTEEWENARIFFERAWREELEELRQYIEDG